MKEERFKIEGEIIFGNKLSTYFIKKGNGFGKTEEEAKQNFVLRNLCPVTNLSLFINKFIPISVDAKIIDTKKRKIENWGGDDIKKFFLNALVNQFKFQNFILNLANRTNDLIIHGYEKIITKSISTQSRLIIGLGSQHVLETSITLHHIFGVPYIPGSALKGVCRAVAFWEIAEGMGIQNNNDELKKFQEKFYGELVKDDEKILKYQLLFGAQNFKGLLLFLDAYLTENNKEIFDLDVMSPHYQRYYSDKEGKTPPGDWENPVPIVFLTLKEGVKFNFNVLFDKFRAENISKMGNEKLKEKAKDISKNFYESNGLKKEIEKLLEKALTNFGIGAKTRLGYGIFE